MRPHESGKTPDGSLTSPRHRVEILRVQDIPDSPSVPVRGGLRATALLPVSVVGRHASTHCREHAHSAFRAIAYTVPLPSGPVEPSPEPTRVASDSRIP